MCLGIPGELVEIRDDDHVRTGKVRYGSIAREVCLACVPDAEIGDFVLVHVGFAIARIDGVAAARAYEELRRLAESEESPP